MNGTKNKGKFKKIDVILKDYSFLFLHNSVTFLFAISEKKMLQAKHLNPTNRSTTST